MESVSIAFKAAGTISSCTLYRTSGKKMADVESIADLGTDADIYRNTLEQNRKSECDNQYFDLCPKTIHTFHGISG